MSVTKVLIVDQQEGLRLSLSRLLSRAGYQVATTGCHDEAIRLSTVINPDVVLVDSGIDECDGFALCQELINGGDSHPDVVMMSECARASESEKARALGAKACLAKPFTFSALTTTLSGIETADRTVAVSEHV